MVTKLKSWTEFVQVVDDKNYRDYVLENKEDKEKVIEYYINKNDSESNLLLAIFYRYGIFVKKDDEKAIYHSKKADCPKAYNLLGLIYLNMDELDLAIENYQKAIEGNYPKAYGNIGWAYDLKEDLDKALENYLKAYELKENLDLVTNRIGIIYDKKKRYDDAEKFYLEAIENGSTAAYLNYALLLDKLTTFYKAIDYYKLYIEKTHRYEALVNIGQIYQKMTIFEVAKSYYLKAIDKKVAAGAYQLAIMYERYYLDIPKAIQYYLIAKDMGIDCSRYIEYLDKIQKQKG